jgi:hypothetical protein
MVSFSLNNLKKINSTFTILESSLCVLPDASIHSRYENNLASKVDPLPGGRKRPFDCLIISNFSLHLSIASNSCSKTPKLAQNCESFRWDQAPAVPLEPSTFQSYSIQLVFQFHHIFCANLKNHKRKVLDF